MAYSVELHNVYIQGYGVVNRGYMTFWKSDFERAKKQGYFMA